MGFSNTTAAAILNDIFRDETIYLALYKSNPTGADTGTEVTGGAYARQLITFATPAIDVGKQTIKNSAEIQFPIATADWGVITHVAIRSALTGGTMIGFGALVTAKTILTGDRFVIALSNGAIKLS
ncbi:phage tail fiber protein [Cohnella lupini]|uniref:Uncharacterized protein n=1 Tax=Cohnella lupini TaxID=1294267 RepID=A0A3D9HZK4_9BACL|nr:hypothetical protein [Cohnella lupini]RED54801.1 hypothetical protein DFP95_12157 [Cohnella lupini]